MLESLAGKRIWIFTLGCRSNQYEGEALANSFVEAGAVLSESPDCDAAVLVSCTVTSIADKKCRQAVRKARRTSPNTIVVACGCWAQNLPEDEAKMLGIHLVVGNRRKGELPALLAGIFDSGRMEFSMCREDVLRSRAWDALFLSRPLLHTRAFVKVQEGCNHFCSYCAVPQARGFPVSRSSEDVLREVHSIISSGCSEIVLTGVHLGLYGKYGEISLAELVRRVASVDGVRRLRFGSIEPHGIDDELLETLAGTPCFQPHLHIPLQSGNERVLSLMNRGYTPGEYRKLLERARTLMGEEVHISTDVLVGFPGEDICAFEETLIFMEECRFGKVHVFPFSPREGTKAFSFPERVCPREISSRSRRALELGEKLLEEYCARWVGREISVLLEKVTFLEGAFEEACAFQGLTPYFLRVNGRSVLRQLAPVLDVGKEVLVVITGVGSDTLKGRLVP